jgi:hypothetical protein
LLYRRCCHVCYCCASLTGCDCRCIADVATFASCSFSLLAVTVAVSPMLPRLQVVPSPYWLSLLLLLYHRCYHVFYCYASLTGCDCCCIAYVTTFASCSFSLMVVTVMRH